jgi:protein TonB
MATLTRIKMVPPEYPAAAHNGRISGTVIFSITVGKDGKVAAVRPISGNPMLLPAASRAISQWLYTPPTVNGQPTEATTTVQLTFSLN